MDNAQKAIMIGVGLFITIIVIAAIMMITGIGQDLISSSTKKLEGMGNELEESLKSTYDQATWSGRQVTAEIKKLSTRADMMVYVVNDMTNKKISNFNASGGTGAYNKPYCISRAYMTLSGVKTNGTGSNITSVTVSTPNDLLSTASTDLAVAISTIAESHKYKSALITNTSNGKTLGVVFVRYQ